MPMNSDSYFSEEIKDTITNIANKRSKIPHMSEKNFHFFFKKARAFQ